MSNLPIIIDAIQWHEGMLLAPQHFQQLTARCEALVTYNVGNTCPYFWGIQKLVIDPSALLEGRLRLLELEAVMPDGLVLQYDARDAALVELSLLPYQSSSDPFTVYLAIAARQFSSGRNSGILARYDSVLDNAANDSLNDAENEISIPRLRPHLALFAGQQPPASYVSLPLLRVHCSEEVYQLCDYLGPTTSISTRSPLTDEPVILLRARTVAAQLREKALFIADRIKNDATGSASLDMRHKLHILTANLPLLEGLLSVGSVHPLQLYLVLCGISGTLSSLAPAAVPALPPAYNHNDIVAVLNALLNSFDESLKHIQEVYERIAFTKVMNGFEVRVPAGEHRNSVVIGLLLPRGQSEDDLAQWMDQATIGAANRIKAMREHRVLGAKRTAVDYVQALELSGSNRLKLYTVELDMESVDQQPLQLIAPPRSKDAGFPEQVYLYVKNA